MQKICLPLLQPELAPGIGADVMGGSVPVIRAP